jgi:hypothetical protein
MLTTQKRFYTKLKRELAETILFSAVVKSRGGGGGSFAEKCPKDFFSNLFYLWSRSCPYLAISFI